MNQISGLDHCNPIPISVWKTMYISRILWSAWSFCLAFSYGYSFYLLILIIDILEPLFCKTEYIHFNV